MLNDTLIAAREASRRLNLTEHADTDKLLERLAENTVRRTGEILTANKHDLERMERNNPKYDRLMLNADRIEAIADGIRKVASLPSPLGVTLDQWTRPNGMRISKVSVPFGVIGVIYEARPNVTLDVFSLCVKSGSAVVLKGGSDAQQSNEAIVRIIADTLAECGLPAETVTLLPPSHQATAEMLNATGLIDLIIPRGGRALIDFVRNNSRVPVIETGAGVCSCYFHSAGDIAKGRDIILNAKTRRVSVCNALDALIIDRARLAAG